MFFWLKSFVFLIEMTLNIKAVFYNLFIYLHTETGYSSYSNYKKATRKVLSSSRV